MNYKENSEHVRQEILEVLQKQKETDIIKVTEANLPMMPLVHAKVLAYILPMATATGKSVEEVLKDCKGLGFLEVPVQLYDIGEYKATAPIGYGNYIKFDFEQGVLNVCRDMLGIVPTNNETYLIDYNNRFGVFPETVSKIYCAIKDSGQNNFCSVSHMWRRKSVTRKLLNKIREINPCKVVSAENTVETFEEFKCPEGAKLIAKSCINGRNTGKPVHRHEFWYVVNGDKFSIYVVNSRGFGKRYFGFDFTNPTTEELKSFVHLIALNTSASVMFEI